MDAVRIAASAAEMRWSPEMATSRRRRKGEKIMLPRVAVLMSVYHRERPQFLRDSLESMLQQTYKNLDLHIYMDGPVRGELADLLSGYAATFPNVYLYRHPENRGLAVCLNDLIVQLRDRYLYFARMDSDDVSLPDRLEKQVEFLELNTDVDVVGGAIIDVSETGREIKRVRYPTGHEEIVRFFRRRNPIAHVTAMYRRTFFEKAGLYPPVRLEDGLYWMQGIASGCRFHNMPDHLVRVRRTDDFLKRRSGLRKAWAEFRIRLTINRRLKFGLASYGYAVALLCLQLLPVQIKQLLYDKLR